jgi:hypothetical protein
MAGPTRLELATSGVTGRRSNQLNYDPAVVVFEGAFSLKQVCFARRSTSAGNF